MGWKALENLKELLCAELEEYKGKDKLGMSDLEIVHKITDTLKNIDKIEMLEGGGASQSYGRYSRDGNSMNSMNSYNSGNSYSRQHYVRGHYSRDGYSRNYSQAGEDMIHQLEGMSENAEPEEREIIRRAMDELKRI